MDQDFVIGEYTTVSGAVPRVSSDLQIKDKWGSFKARWGVRRMDFRVDPGLYALGNPDDKSTVLVSANYKMSFDYLRKELKGRDLWILVLDTDGVNVWCAAGKGTFGTEELVNRIELTGLSGLVSHRELILPQLSGPGISAHQVKKLSGFKVTYGPVLAEDLPEFIESGNKATQAMRKKGFTAAERLVLVPVELVTAFKWAVIISMVFFLISGFGGQEGFLANALNHGLLAVAAVLSGVAAGAILTPFLLPWLPGRAFALKGVGPALIAAIVLALFRIEQWGSMAGRLEILAWFFIIPAISAYLAMNFTGCSTYTSLSGVRKEMKVAVPMEIAAGVIGIFIWIGSRFAA